MIVADNRQNAAKSRGPGRVGVFEDIAGAVDARCLAIPDAEQAIEPRAWEETELLRAPDGRGPEVFVQPFPEFDIMVVQPGLGRAQLLVISAERGAAIA